MKDKIVSVMKLPQTEFISDGEEVRERQVQDARKQ